jgi:hypothetical protein
MGMVKALDVGMGHISICLLSLHQQAAALKRSMRRLKEHKMTAQGTGHGMMRGFRNGKRALPCVNFLKRGCLSVGPQCWGRERDGGKMRSWNNG